MTTFSRRTFLTATAASVAVPGILAACSGTGGEKVELIRFNQDGYMIPGKQRLPIGLADTKGAVITTGPDKLTGRVLGADGKALSATLTATRRSAGLPRPFWLFEMTVDRPGQYQLEVDTSGGKKAMAFSVTDPKLVNTPKPGDPLLFVDTPTTKNPLGVNPLCTRNPFCPFHAVSLKDAKALGKPIVFIISTPAYCQFAVCGPVLDFVIAEERRLAGKLTVVHSEVYTDDTKDNLAPTVEAYNVSFEPVLYLADRTGTVVDRWDVLFDQVELGKALDALVA